MSRHRNPSAASAVRAAFTLIELLVVMAIIAVLVGMITVGELVDRDRVALDQAALELRTTIAKARSLAMREQANYAITFNITTPGDGRVIRNYLESDPSDFKGRHWYALVKSVHVKDTKSYKPMNWPPSAYASDWGGGGLPGFASFTRKHYVGPRHYLPRGVRFLALSDIDGGTGKGGKAGESGGTRLQPTNVRSIGAWYRPSHLTVYPVPWFGTVVQASTGNWRLLPWGFYEDDGPDVVQGGLVSSGVGTPKDRYFRPASCWRGGRAYTGFEETTSSGPVKHVVAGDLLDAYLEFYPDGRIEWKHRYVNSTDIYTEDRDTKDRTIWEWSSLHHREITGGFHFTLARDVDETDPIYRYGNFHEFENRRDALASITPFVRVFVHQHSGQTELRAGLPTAPNMLDWVEADGTVNDLEDTDPAWQGIHPFCRVQQQQKPYSYSDADFMPPSAYHLFENDYVSFKPAGTW